MKSCNGWAQVASRLQGKVTLQAFGKQGSHTQKHHFLWLTGFQVPLLLMSLSPATRTALVKNIHIHMNAIINKNLHVCEQLQGLSLISAPCKSLLSLKMNTDTSLSLPYTKRIEPRVSRTPGQCCTS